MVWFAEGLSDHAKSTFWGCSRCGRKAFLVARRGSCKLFCVVVLFAHFLLSHCANHSRPWNVTFWSAQQRGCQPRSSLLKVLRPAEYGSPSSPRFSAASATRVKLFLGTSCSYSSREQTHQKHKDPCHHKSY